jgi:hypothetical protein
MTTVENTGSEPGHLIINMEIFDTADAQVEQQFLDGQTLHPGEVREVSFSWTSATDGPYRVAVGLVHLFWDDVYEWVNDAATIGGGE